MHKSFDEARLKIKWANKHIDELERRLRSFNEIDSYVIHVNYDPDAGCDVLKVETTQVLDEDLALIVGDALNSLRCALDYIIRPFIFKPTKHSKFPGPVQVTVGIPPALEQFCLKENVAIPTPVTGYALIDTRAHAMGNPRDPTGQTAGIRQKMDSAGSHFTTLNPKHLQTPLFGRAVAHYFAIQYSSCVRMNESPTTFSLIT